MNGRYIIEGSKWSEEFKIGCFSGYGKALKLLSDCNYKVKIIEGDETAKDFDVDMMYHIVPINDDGFWLDTKFSKEDAIELCNRMNWEVVE